MNEADAINSLTGEARMQWNAGTKRQLRLIANQQLPDIAPDNT
ncbi:MAG TPA: hypothetical protein VFC35_10690 [Gemmatimonadaceae bacterium]|nr:hypothetical protein [Gemmatimonadaceae bacterium]